MIYSSERKSNNQNQNLNAHIYKIWTWSDDCSLCSRHSSFIMSDLVGPPRPSPCCLCLCWALTVYLSPFLGAGSSLTPCPHADPISLRPQATACFHVGHSKYVEADWDSPSTESTLSESPHGLCSCGVRLYVNRVNTECAGFTKISSFHVDSADLESHSALTQLTWSLTRRWLSSRGMSLHVNWVTAKNYNMLANLSIAIE